MKKFRQFFKAFFNRHLQEIGSALPMVIFAGALVAAGGLLLSKSGEIINLTGRASSEMTIINNIVQDIQSGLSERGTCTVTRDGGFVNLGGYAQGARVDQQGALEAGTNITLNWVVNNLPAGYFNPDPDPININQIDVITLSFNVTSSARGARTITRDIFIQNFQTNVNTAAGNEEDFCMSFEYGSGSQLAINTFCDTTIGGSLNADGSCNLDAAGNTVIENGDFQREVREFACQIIGGVYGAANNPCNQLDIDGALHSDQFFNDNPGDQIVLDDSGDIRSAIVDYDCPANSVAVGFNADGTLNCQVVDCNAAFTGGSSPVYSSYTLVDTGTGYQCRCQRDFSFGHNMHNVTLTPPVDSNRYNTGSETSNGADMHAMISPWKRPGDYNGSATSNNNKTIGCNDEDPYACRDYDWNDGCAMGTTCTILRGRFPGCGVTTTSEHKVIINSCNDICAFGPSCDSSDFTTTGARADGCAIENDPSPPTITCSGQTVAGTCTVPEAGAGSTNVSGSCAGGQVGTCTVTCSVAGNWEVPNTTSCTAPTSACNGLPDTTEFDNLSSCTTQAANTNYWSCEVRSTKYCRLGRSCDRSTLSIPNATITSTSGYDQANQNYGGTVICDDASPAPTVTCDGATGNYNIIGSCGSVSTCNPSAVSWSSGNCDGSIDAIYSQGAVVNVVDNTTSMQGDADFLCDPSGSWVVNTGDPETCVSGPGNCTNSSLNPPNATTSQTTGVTPNGNTYGGTITCLPGYTGTVTASCNSGTWNTSGSCSLSGSAQCRIRAYSGGTEVIVMDFNQVLLPGDSELVTNAQHSTYNTNCVGSGGAACSMSLEAGGRRYSCSTDCNNNAAPSVANGSFPTGGTTANGATFNGTCNTGYTGSPSVTCSGGSWGSVSGSCVPYDCTSPYGMIGDTSSRTCGSCAQKLCQFGTENIECTGSGWSSTSPCMGLICVPTGMNCP